MRETKSQKGITLIALIVTIIVLIIIAGISIATLTADNGVLRQVNSAKVSNIEGTAREQMNLAASAMRIAIAEAAAQDNSYRANNNVAAIQNELHEMLVNDTTALEADGWKKGTTGEGTFTITYEGDDYKNACNDDNAVITYTITLAQRSIEVTDVATGIKGADGSDISIDIGAESGNGGGSGGSTLGAYLVDQVEIGDYVDIGIEYTNPGTFYPDYVSGTYASCGPTGWRVLSKSGSGSTGTVTLVSAGTPLQFYHPSWEDAQSSIDNYLTTLNTTITLVSSGTQGYTANGFTAGTNNLTEIWSSNENIVASSAHPLTVNELMTAYNTLTNQSGKTIDDIWYNDSSEYACRTSVMLTYNSGMSAKAYDLLGNGITYWLGELSSDESSLWFVGSSGVVNYNDDVAYGVRPVVSLKSGVKIAGDNRGTGADVSTAYKLAE